MKNGWRSRDERTVYGDKYETEGQKKDERRTVDKHCFLIRAILRICSIFDHFFYLFTPKKMMKINADYTNTIKLQNKS